MTPPHVSIYLLLKIFAGKWPKSIEKQGATKYCPANGTKLVYMLINILKAYEVTEIEKSLTDLELAHLEV
jgi:hypothetical protein